MVECDRGDLVCLYLAEYADGRDRSLAPPEITATGIGDALEVGDAAASRVALLGDLQRLKAAGLIESEERPVEGYDHPQTVYSLTDAGRDHATRVRDRVSGETVVVTNGTSEEVPLSEVGRYLTDTDVPLVTALARAGDDDRVPLDPNVETSFVGRSEELRTVREAIAKSFTRASRTVVVSGPSGIGKTALVREAVEQVRDDHEDLVVATGDSPPGPTHAYEPFRQAFEVVPDDGRLIGRLARARSEVSPADRDEAAAQRQSLFADIESALRDAATERPVVVFLDNLQWADEATLELFAHLATSVDDWLHPVAFVGTYRSSTVAANDDHPLPDVLSRLSESDTYAETTLDPLSREETRALLADVLGRHRLPDAFVEAVRERTGGNPLFVRELAVHLQETGRVDVDAGRYPDAPAELALPGEVTDQITDRLRALDDPGLDLVRLGAVLGERVPGDVLATASDLSPARHREYVDALQASRIWEPAGTDEEPATDGGVVAGDLRFVSGGLREAVVDRLPPDRAREYHARVADALCEVADDRQTARIAHHYEVADRPDRAVEYYRRAGDHARETYAHQDAIEHYENALRLARDLDREETALDLREAIADVQFLTGDYDRARREYRDIQQRAADPRRRRRAARYRSEMCTAVGEADEAVDIADDGLADWDGEQSDPEVCRLLICKGEGLNKRGDAHEAEAVLAEALEMAREIGRDELVGRALHHVGVTAIRLGEDPEETEARLRREIEVLEGTGERRLRSKAYNNLAIVRMRAGDLAAARDAFERCLEIQEAVGDEMAATTTRGNLGIVYLREGEIDAAVETYHEAIESARRLGDRDTLASIHGNLGDAYERGGDLELAGEHLRRCLEIYRDLENESSRLHAAVSLAHLEHLRGDLDGALERVEAVVEAVEGVNAYEHEFALGILGVVRRELGDLTGAIEAHERMVELAEEIGADERIAGSHTSLGVTYLAAGELESAGETLQVARDTVEEMVAPWRSVTVLRAHGRYKLRSGDLAEAERDLQESLELARHLGGRVEECLTLRALGRLDRRRGNDRQARERFETARSIAAESGATLLVRKCRDELDHDDVGGSSPA